MGLVQTSFLKIGLRLNKGNNFYERKTFSAENFSCHKSCFLRGGENSKGKKIINFPEENLLPEGNLAGP